MDFKCEIKFASSWQKVTGNKWVTATEPNHLNEWIIYKVSHYDWTESFKRMNHL